MRKFTRDSEPEFLACRWEKWGQEYEQRRKANPSASFHWHEVDGQRVNQKLLPFLKQQTQDHCSFCDAFPVAPPSIDTIEHFRPKSSFPRLAYQWQNLYFCCAHCQQKGEDFEEALLCPDAENYDFDRYFRWDFTQGTMEINTLASPEEQNRAEATIRLYKLNAGHPRFRKLALKNRSDTALPDETPYRHYVNASTPG